LLRYKEGESRIEGERKSFLLKEESEEGNPLGSKQVETFPSAQRTYIYSSIDEKETLSPLHFFSRL
jgi:hypothetical protein